ncbi:hypothetical protein HZR84_03650 [Hyphobacterium sp. CCMP332]|nr:hypothetical protein HZR84_03650 [Hyphobacterium sp. CCMP332]
MALRIPVYIASVNNLSDARYCAGMGVKWLGFSSQDLGSILSENDLKGILQWVEGIETVLEIRNYNLNADLLKMDFDSYLSKEAGLFPQDEKSKIFEFNIESSKSLKSSVEHLDHYDYLLLKSSEDTENIDEAQKKLLLSLAGKFQLILGFGITMKNLKWIEKELKPAGIMLKGGNEIRPGFKDFDELADILEYLEID